MSIGQLKNLKDGQRQEQIRSLGTLARMKLVHLASIALSKATGEVEVYTKVLHDLTNDLWSEAKRDEDIDMYLTRDQEMETSPRGYRYTPAEIAQSNARLVTETDYEYADFYPAGGIADGPESWAYMGELVKKRRRKAGAWEET